MTWSIQNTGTFVIDSCRVATSRVPGLKSKEFDEDLCHLLTELREPRPISCLPDGALSAVQSLIFDGVLSVSGDGMEPATGPCALAVVAPRRDNNGSSTTAAISAKAINLATMLPQQAPVESVAHFLYRFGTLPIPQTLQPQLPDVTLASLAPWSLPQPSEATDGWLMFWPTSSYSATTHKIYVNLRPGSIQEAWPILVKALSALGAPPFKVGKGLTGTHRPDKIVVYLATAAQCYQSASRLVSALRSFDVQPLPFTKQLDDRGLITAGMDPENHGFGSNDEPASWRSQTCASIADAIRTAQILGAGPKTVAQAAQHRVEVSGIDPTTWEPSGWHPDSQTQQESLTP